MGRSFARLRMTKDRGARLFCMTDKRSKFAIAILAAGKGTRLKSKHPKVLHEIAGKPLLGHVVAAAAKVVPPEHIFAIIGHEAERVRQAMQATGMGFVEQ